MKRFRYTSEHIDFLRDGFRKMGIPDLTVAFNAEFGLNKSWQEIRSTLKNHKLTCGRAMGELQKGKSLIFTTDQVQFIKDNYQRFSRQDLTLELNKTFQVEYKVSQLVAFVKNHKVTSGRTGQFEKGSKSWNKGTKGMTSRNRTTFAKGNDPANRKGLWSERIDSKEGFILVKVPERDPYTGFPTRYKHKHIWIWEQTNGLIPDGSAVVFKDGDRLNCVLENLVLVTRNELLSLNLHGYRKMPEELKPVVLSIARIEAKGRFRTRPGRGRMYA